MPESAVSAPWPERPVPIKPIRQIGMATFRFPGIDDEPRREKAPMKPVAQQDDPVRAEDVVGQVPSTEAVLKALDDVSRRMETLARSLGCLGYFDDDDEGPRAA